MIDGVFDRSGVPRVGQRGGRRGDGGRKVATAPRASEKVVTRNAGDARPRSSRGTRRSESARTSGCCSADSGSSVALGDTMVRIRSARARRSPRNGERPAPAVGFPCAALFEGATPVGKEYIGRHPLTDETRRFLSDRPIESSVEPFRRRFASSRFRAAFSSARLPVVASLARVTSTHAPRATPRTETATANANATRPFVLRPPRIRRPALRVRSPFVGTSFARL